MLNRSNNPCLYTWKPIETGESFKNLNETRNASSPGFFLKILNSIFQSINMDVNYKLLLQLFRIGFCLFWSKAGNNEYRDFI